MTMTPDAMLAEIDRRIKALGDPHDARSDNERLAYKLAYEALDRRRIALRDAVPELAKLEPQISTVQLWLEHLTAWRAEWQKELAETPEDQQRYVDLREAILQVDNGVAYINQNAMLAPLLRQRICATYPPSWDGPKDPWAVGHGSIHESEAKLARLTKKRDAQQSRLDAALREPVTV